MRIREGKQCKQDRGVGVTEEQLEQRARVRELDVRIPGGRAFQGEKNNPCKGPKARMASLRNSWDGMSKWGSGWSQRGNGEPDCTRRPRAVTAASAQETGVIGRGEVW